MDEKHVYNRQELMNTVTTTLNNLLDRMEEAGELIDGSAIAHDLDSDEKGRHFQLVIDWWMKEDNT